MARKPGSVHPGNYLLPNLLTTFNLACGILAILLTLENSTAKALGGQNYAISAWLILAAVIFDFLDGKVARWTHAVSEFGVKIDSLADFISFGIAPVVITYFALLQNVPLLIRGLSGGLFLFGGAWRLARFNCEVQTQDNHTYFKGLPIPAAAAFVCTIVLVNSGPGNAGVEFLSRSFLSLPQNVAGSLSALVLVMLAGLMISRIHFPAFKKVNRRNLILLGGVAMFFGVLLLVIPPENIVFLIMLLYLIIGLFRNFSVRVLRWQHKKIHKNDFTGE
ncbi:CDP-diacylglycerol--serine O-phosphatidyltransferase [bacterium]|nr:CDP-diacylglycerol--serine O-phosphatidyltransferase [bacterium]